MAPGPHGTPGLLLWPRWPPCSLPWRNCWDLFPRPGATSGRMGQFLAFLSGVLFFVLAFRWVRRRILWRLRNRLIVTYMFIGVIPAVLLIAMALITLYGLGGQFAVFVVTSEIQRATAKPAKRSMPRSSNELAARLERGDKPAAESLAGLKKRDPRMGPPPGLRLVRGQTAAPLRRDSAAPRSPCRVS